MLRTLVMTLLLGAVPRGCACAGTADDWSAQSEATSSTTAAVRDEVQTAVGASGGGYSLPEGIGPASGGGKCVAPELREVDVRDPSPMSLEERLFGTATGEVSVKDPEPCP